jgi:hypothetical protein
MRESSSYSGTTPKLLRRFAVSGDCKSPAFLEILLCPVNFDVAPFAHFNALSVVFLS